MIVHIPLLVFLLANVYPSDAALLGQSPESLTRAARHARRHVIKRSSGLWEDMRLAYAGLRQQQKPQVLETQSKLYCTNVGSGLTGIGSVNGSENSSGNGSGNGSDGSSGSSITSEPLATPSSSSASFPASGTSSSSKPSSTGSSGGSNSSSPWKVAQNWVGNCSRCTYGRNIHVYLQNGGSFFDGWNFINAADVTTHGIAQYVDQQTAVSPAIFLTV